MSEFAVSVGAVDLNAPGNYLHWSIFTISEANLLLIAVMVLIFGGALLLPFPGKKHQIEEIGSQSVSLEDADALNTSQAEAVTSQERSDLGEDEDASMWTSRIRRRALRMLPPGKLLPDRQPAYVASWVYVFGVASLATLGLAIASGFLIAIGGTDWWHTNPVGHFFNSLHLWSVEAFMAFIVIHLWGKFWMAAWRGRRALTWITGVVAFGASVVECFTGYLSQQNFDSQWIATNGKDAFNSTGFGSLFNLMNFGQMLLWHVVLIPLVLLALVGAHILAVRVRGVVRPLPAQRVRGREARRVAAKRDAAEWRGPKRRYDIVKEAAVAIGVSLLLVVALAAVLSSPDDPPVTVATWAKVAPADFLGTAASELAGTSETATYGPPYNSGSSNVQRIIISPQSIGGVHQNIDTAKTFVLNPLGTIAPTDPSLAAAIREYENASPTEQAKWNDAYAKAVESVTFRNGQPVLPKADDGPIPFMLSTELTLARGGAIDSDLLANREFYGNNFTAPLLFLEDGQYYSGLAEKQHLTGTQWGVMNETGSYPGQPWLWLYTLWYQLPGLDNSANIDLIAVGLTGVATLLLLAVPFIPGLRDIPRLIPVHRLIWREWGKTEPQGAVSQSSEGKSEKVEG